MEMFKAAILNEVDGTILCWAIDKSGSKGWLGYVGRGK